MSPRRAATHDVLIVAYPGVQLLDVAGPHEVLAGANAVVGGNAYNVTVVAAESPTASESGLAMVTAPLPQRGPIGTLMIAGGSGVHEAVNDRPLVDWVARAAHRSSRLATICSGAFLAAEAGLLDGRTVTTHWARAAALAERYPAVTVDPDPIYVRDGSVWTSAGVTAGIDLALALVECDHGAEVANVVARWLVMFRHRPGGQSQFATPAWTKRAEQSAVRDVQEFIDDHPEGDLRIDQLAARASMSERHFARTFTAATGETPGRYVSRVRLDAARQLLESSDSTVAVVAERCGFGTAETLRRTFQRRLGVSPDSYRRRFHRAGTPHSEPPHIHRPTRRPT